MNHTIALIKRNAKLFLRDRATVFFSFLSTLIMVALYFLFIGRIYIDDMNNVAPITKAASGFVVYAQMMAGVLVLNSMSLTLGMFSVAAKDFESKRADCFLTMPVKRRELLVSYFAGGLAVSFLLNLFTWVLSIILIGAATGYWISIGTAVAATGVLVVSSVISSSIMMLITVAVRSSTAIGVISGIAGTFLGFLCGIYMPYSNLGSSVKAVGSLIPFTHITVWFKNLVLTDVFAQIGVAGEVKDVLMNDYFTANGVGFAGMDIPLWATLVYAVAVGLVCLTAAGLMLRKRFRMS
ncbi:MAG: ABC transporter permease [Firmicutes bacterium]|nr:ABC transporter permease [Bacillota bacterium]